MSAPAQLNAALTGRYAIEREIGRGGMATVYLARDLRHERRVALKVLSPELGAVLGVERFLAEIRVTANLQHPNLLPLFDSGEADGLLFYVMPFVEGESLRARLEREKQLSIDEAVRLTVAVAGALDYAHRHSVIHRDLKPENILLHEGQPLIADFGIALAVSNAGGNRITQTGLSLGTPQYMSPEQATGDRQLDARSDIYSLGAVLYETLTGEAPHSGPTAQAVIAKVLTDRPRSIRLARDTVPESVEYAVERALAKLPADRWATAQEFAGALQGRGIGLTGAATAGFARPTRPAPTWRERARDPLVVSLALLLVAAAGIAAWLATRAWPADTPTMRFSLLPPDVPFVSTGGTAMAISPDGQTVVYAGIGAGSWQLYVRRLSDDRVRPLPLTAIGQFPAISPDGKWVAFLSNQLKKMPVDGGPVTPIASIPPQGLAWISNDSLIVVSSRVLNIISANGGDPQPVTTIDWSAGDRGHQFPRTIGDGNTVFFQSTQAGNPPIRKLGVLSVKERRSTILDFEGGDVLGMIDDWLIYVSGAQRAMAVRFDLKRHRLLGEPVSLGLDIFRGTSSARAALSKSGTLVYQGGSVQGQLVRWSGQGATPVLSELRRYYAPRLSPDGRKIAVTIDTDIWVYDITSGTPTRLTNGDENDRVEWTPDSKRVLYRTARDGAEYLRWQPVDGSGPAEELLRLGDGPQEGVISPDGQWLLFRKVTAATRRDIFYKRLRGDTSIHPIAVSEFDELQPRISPDGKWVAYASDESGVQDVYLRPFPGPGGRVKVSADGGAEPVWSRSDRRLFYRRGRELWAATLSSSSTPSITHREKVLETTFMAGGVHANYDVFQDGGFLMITQPSGDAPVFVVHNWAKEVRERLRDRN